MAHRGERAHQTLQDRLVKALRLQGFQTLAAANAWLPTFLADDNRRFAVARVTVCEAFDGSIELLHESRAVPWRLLTEGPPPIPVKTEKTLALRLAGIRQAKRHRPRSTPASDHP